MVYRCIMQIYAHNKIIYIKYCQTQKLCRVIALHELKNAQYQPALVKCDVKIWYVLTKKHKLHFY